MEYKVRMDWDSETERWTAVIEDGIRLVLESSSYDALVERVKIAVRDILEVDMKYRGAFTLRFETDSVVHMRAIS